MGEFIELRRGRLGCLGAVGFGGVGGQGFEGADDLEGCGLVSKQLLRGLRGRGELLREELGWEMVVSLVQRLLVLLLEECLLLLPNLEAAVVRLLSLL